MTSQLQRIVIDLRAEEMVLRVLYRSEDGPGPNTKARTREVSQLIRTGLEQAREALEGRVDVVGVSGYELREDVILATTSPDAAKQVKKAAS
jgi:hypothetical protein